MINLLLEIKQRNLIMGAEPEDIFLGPELGLKRKEETRETREVYHRVF